VHNPSRGAASAESAERGCRPDPSVVLRRENHDRIELGWPRLVASSRWRDRTWPPAGARPDAGLDGIHYGEPNPRASARHCHRHRRRPRYEHPELLRPSNDLPRRSRSGAQPLRPDQRPQITGETDPDQADRWAIQPVHIEDAEDTGLRGEPEEEAAQT